MVLESQPTESAERAKRPLMPPVHYLRAIRAYSELQTVVTGVGQVKQTATIQTHTLRICNSNFFSTTITVTRTRLNVTLHVHCLSCSYFTHVMRVAQV